MLITFVLLSFVLAQQIALDIREFNAPSTSIRIFFNRQLFPSGQGSCPHASGEFDSESGNFLNPLPRVEKDISLTNLITCGRVNLDIVEPDDVAIRVLSLTEQ